MQQTAEEFVLVWMAAGSVSAVAEAIEKTPDEVLHLAHVLRLCGVGLPEWPRHDPDTCEECMFHAMSPRRPQ